MPTVASRHPSGNAHLLRAKAQRANERRKAQLQEARKALRELKPELRRAQSDYDHALKHSTRKRRGESVEAINEDFDRADLAMNRLTGLDAQRRALEARVRELQR